MSLTGQRAAEAGGRDSRELKNPGAYYSGTWAELYHGDSAEVLKAYGDNTFAAVVSDPPYGLSEREPPVEDVLRSWLAGAEYEPENGRARGFMNEDWDGFVPGPGVWREILRVLKPGGFLFAFAGTRTRDYLGLALRLAGFRVEDSIEWLTAQGFPTRNRRAELALAQKAGAGARGARRRAHGMVPTEGLESARHFEGRGTALKPAHESILIAKKPLAERNLARNLIAHGTGTLGIDACRVAAVEGEPPGGVWGSSNETVANERRMLNNSPAAAAYRSERHPRGRYPANVVLSCCGPAAEKRAKEETPCVGCPVAELDRQSGIRKSGANPTRRASDKFSGVYSPWAGQQQCEPGRGESIGGASRFYFCAKASTREREAGLRGLPETPVRWSNGSANPGSFQSEGSRRASRNPHVAVKPIELMRWLLRLAVPGGGLVLDPFAGSGTTGVAATLEGVQAVLVEREEEYLEVIRARLSHAEADFTNPDPAAEPDHRGPGLWRSAPSESHRTKDRKERRDEKDPNAGQLAFDLFSGFDPGPGSSFVSGPRAESSPLKERPSKDATDHNETNETTDQDIRGYR